MSDGPTPSQPPDPFEADSPTLTGRLKRVVLGQPRDLRDQSLFHRLALIPFLAWVGLGADGLSSSAYGPEEAFKALGDHRYLALVLALMAGGTVLLIASAYSRLIEEFPHGGGGYYVATRLLGRRAGVVSGSALLVDYVLTITVSVAAAGDALFSLAPVDWAFLKLPVEVAFIAALTTLNLRGVRESVTILAPVFVLFLITHALFIGGGIAAHLPQATQTLHGMRTELSQGSALLGWGGLLLLLLRAYSLGGGTYTGIEAVSNGLPIMREPRVATAKRTMAYMAISLAVTAAGLILCYLLWDVRAVPGRTMNATLLETMTGRFAWGPAFTAIALLSEGALLVVAAQAGFLDGPRVLANMAADSWVPHRFAALSQRLTTSTGIMLMGSTALAALLYTRGNVAHLVVMYSINVFVTFSMSMIGMCRHWWEQRGTGRRWRTRLLLFVTGALACLTILGVTVVEKFAEGGWITVLATGGVVALCFAIRRHYDEVKARLATLHRELDNLPPLAGSIPEFDPKAPTAVVLVGSYGGLGLHTVLNVFRSFPGYFKNLEFVSVGVLEAGAFKSADAVAEVERATRADLERYVELANKLGVPARHRMAVGTEAVEALEKLCLSCSRELKHCSFFAGKVIFQRDTWWRRILHNQTAFDLQSRLQWQGMSMVIMPARLR